MRSLFKKTWQGLIGGRVKMLVRFPLLHIATTPQDFLWMGIRHRLTFYKLLRRVIKHQVPGAVVELGCAHGQTSALIAKILRSLGAEKEFHVYDSFQGLPVPAIEDGENNMLKEGGICIPRQMFIERFKLLSSNLDLPIIHEGWFKDTLPGGLPRQIAFAYVDADFYDSILCALRHLYPRLSPGAVVYIDDYRHPRLPGVEKAVDKFLADKPEKLVFLPPCPEYHDEGKAQGYFIKE